jgi:hypothetical protein
MADKKVIIAIFESEAAADEAVRFMTGADIARNDAIGVLALDEHGNVKTHKVGSHSFFKGAGIGAVLGLLGPIGLGAAAMGGGLLGLLHHKGLGLGEADRDRIGRELQDGKAAVGVLLSEDYEETAVVASLTDLGGVVESHAVSDEALEEVAAASPPAEG